MGLRFLVFVVAFLLAFGPAGAFAQANQEPPDFRAYVFGAYTIAFLLLFAFAGYLYARQRQIDREIGALKKRIERKAQSGT